MVSWPLMTLDRPFWPLRNTSLAWGLASRPMYRCGPLGDAPVGEGPAAVACDGPVFTVRKGSGADEAPKGCGVGIPTKSFQGRMTNFKNAFYVCDGWCRKNRQII